MVEKVSLNKLFEKFFVPHIFVASSPYECLIYFVYLLYKRF